MGEWMYRSTFSWPRHYLEMSGQLDAPAALLQAKEPRYPLGRRLGGPQRRSERRGENSWPYRDLNCDPLVVQPVARRYTDWAIPLPKTFLKVADTSNRQPYGRKVRCVQRDLRYNDFGSYHWKQELVASCRRTHYVTVWYWRQPQRRFRRCIDKAAVGRIYTMIILICLLNRHLPHCKTCTCKTILTKILN
jgi:hypothetical protein